MTTTTTNHEDLFAEWPLDQVAYLEEQLLSLHQVHLGDRKSGRLNAEQEREIAQEIPEYWEWYSTHLAAAAARLDGAGVRWSRGYPSHRVLGLRVVNGPDA